MEKFFTPLRGDDQGNFKKITQESVDEDIRSVVNLIAAGTKKSRVTHSKKRIIMLEVSEAHLEALKRIFTLADCYPQIFRALETSKRQCLEMAVARQDAIAARQHKGERVEQRRLEAARVGGYEPEPATKQIRDDFNFVREQLQLPKPERTWFENRRLFEKGAFEFRTALESEGAFTKPKANSIALSLIAKIYDTNTKALRRLLERKKVKFR